MITDERFAQVIKDHIDHTFLLQLSSLDVAALHGALVLACKHPSVKSGTMPHYTQIVGGILMRLDNGFRGMGFTDEEIRDLYRDGPET